jgi:uncharacterized protein
MPKPPIILIDSGILVAYYSPRDHHHVQVCKFLEQCTSRLLTTTICIAETMWLLNSDWRVQNQLLSGVISGVFEYSPLISQDFSRIAELNAQYADLPGDFADLSLIAISERLNIATIATLDSDFNVYRRYRNQPFDRIWLPS